VGYTLRTWGPRNWQTKWYPFTFFNPTPPITVYNEDGTVTLNNNSGAGSSYNAHLCTCKPNAGTPLAHFQGTAFGGGGYFECEMRFTPLRTGLTKWPSFWSLCVEQAAGGDSGSIYNSHWDGQAAGYNHDIEPDFFEYGPFGPTQHGGAMHDYAGPIGSQSTTNANTGSPFTPPGIDYTAFNKFGYLWVPATATTNGYAKFFANDVQVGNTVTWSQNNDIGNTPPASGTQIGSILDRRHLMVIIGNSTTGVENTQMIVKSVNVWQATIANNYYL
jgi:hypothetical protein